MLHKLLVRWLSFFFTLTSFSSNLAILYCSDHRPRIIGSERDSQSHTVSDGMWALAPAAIKNVEYALPPLGRQNEPSPPTTPTEIRSDPRNVVLQTSALSLPQSPQPIPPSHFSGNHTHIKYLEQLLDSSLATVAVIQFSGNTLADVLTPRAYDTFKALYALAALDAPTSSTKPRGIDPLTRSTFSDIGNDCSYSSNHSPPLPSSSLAVPRTGRMHVHISISLDYVMLFSWAGLAVVSCLVVFSICLGFAKGM